MSVEAVHDPSAIIARITENIRLAHEGEAAAAVNSAMLIHLFPEESARLNLRSKYSTLLSQALMSLNPELLVCVAEELLKGEKLAADGHLATRFLDRADKFSPYMGSYVRGRLFLGIDRSLAIKLFTEGCKVGHIPSTIYRHKLLCKKFPGLGELIKVYFIASDFFLAWKAIREEDSLAVRFWRYRDCFHRPLLPVDKIIGPDRLTPFVDIESF